MVGSNLRVPVTDNGNDNGKEISWAVRPGGMVVQNREDDAQEQQGFDGSSLMIKVSHGSNLHNITVPSASTFGNSFFKVQFQSEIQETIGYFVFYRFLVRRTLFFSIAFT